MASVSASQAMIKLSCCVSIYPWAALGGLAAPPRCERACAVGAAEQLRQVLRVVVHRRHQRIERRELRLVLARELRRIGRKRGLLRRDALEVRVNRTLVVRNQAARAQ